MMIKSFRDDWLRDFFYHEIRTKKIPPTIEKSLFRKLQILDNMKSFEELRAPKSNHFEKLLGNLDGFYSIRVNRKWRLVFRLNTDQGALQNLYLDDHSYQ